MLHHTEHAVYHRAVQVKIRPTILDDKEEAAIRPHAFLVRMLHNLKSVYRQRDDPEKCLRIQQYLRCATPAAPPVSCQHSRAPGPGCMQGGSLFLPPDMNTPSSPPTFVG